MSSVGLETDRCEICRRPASLRPDPFSPTREAMLCASCFELLAGQATRPPICPFKFKEEFWPDVRFYEQQMQIIESVVETPQTIVVAGNKLGKDFVAGYVILWYFLTGGGRGFDIMTRIVTTSVNADHLDVLWGEIHRFIQSCKVELDSRRGGPIIVNQLELRKIMPTTRRECPKSYTKAKVVSAQGEGLAGHHCPATLFVSDESSGIEKIAFEQASTWAKRQLIFGNPLGTTNHFKELVKGGDILMPEEAAA